MRHPTRTRSGALPPGVVWLPPSFTAADVASEAAERGFATFVVDAHELLGKTEFIAAVMTAVGAPTDVGHNWDALEEVLRDLSWATSPGFVLLLIGTSEFAASFPSSWAIAVDVFRMASSAWASRGRPFYTVIASASLGGASAD